MEIYWSLWERSLKLTEYFFDIFMFLFYGSFYLEFLALAVVAFN